MTERYVAALEIGSFKITGSVGVFNPEKGTLRVIATEQLPSRDSVRYGIIQNPEEAGSRISKIIEKLEENPAVEPSRIAGVFVGLSGRSMRSIPTDVKISFPQEMDITGEMLKDLRDDANSIDLDSNTDILASLPRAYYVDGMDTASPKGSVGKSIAASFDIIVGRSDIKRNLIRAVSERAGLEIKGMVVTAIAASDVVLSDEEKRLGCMLVDFGAETTAVSIYQKGSLCYYATIPLGGRNITRDLTTLPLLEEKAEQIKIESGRAVVSETPSDLNINGLELTKVNNMVVARSEEIVANVIQQIFYAGLTEKDLPAGIVCIGAAANLIGLLDLISTQSGLSARKGSLQHFVSAADQRSKRHDAIESVAILYAGALTGIEGCLEAPEEEEFEEQFDDTAESDSQPEPKAEKSGFWSGFGSRLSKIFAPPADDETELD